MGAERVLLVLLVVCVFKAAVDSLNIKCEDVTGHVGDKLTLTCRVSYKDNTRCMMMYKFTNKDKGTTICREEFRKDPCIQSTSISCPYTANEVMITTFKVFIQFRGGQKSEDFTVNITEASKGEQTAEIVSTEDPPGKTGNTVLVVTGLVICLVVVAVGLILRRRYNRTNILQRDYDLGEREENNINEPENTEEV